LKILDIGMNCLIEKIGVIETERFISTLMRERADYTKWRQRYFAQVNSDEFHQATVDYSKNNPLK